jgi:hypothetical protein
MSKARWFLSSGTGPLKTCGGLILINARWLNHSIRRARSLALKPWYRILASGNMFSQAKDILIYSSVSQSYDIPQKATLNRITYEKNN